MKGMHWKALGISVGLLGLGMALVGSLAIAVSLGALTTGFLAPLGMIGLAGSAAMVGVGVALMITGIGFYAHRAGFFTEIVKVFTGLIP